MNRRQLLMSVAGGALAQSPAPRYRRKGFWCMGFPRTMPYVECCRQLRNAGFEGLDIQLGDEIKLSSPPDLGLENLWNKFLLSPIEMRSLVDQLKRPWVKVHFDVANPMQYGYPQDWIWVTSLGSVLRSANFANFCFTPIFAGSPNGTLRFRPHTARRRGA